MINSPKYRVWIKDEGYMAKVVEMDFGEPVQVCVNSTGIKEWYYLDEVILMQYTGLDDINGVEVYDEDIVKSGGRLYKVRFGADKILHYREVDTHDYIEKLGDMQVVGNIHKDNNLLGERR